MILYESYFKAYDNNEFKSLINDTDNRTQKIFRFKRGGKH